MDIKKIKLSLAFFAVAIVIGYTAFAVAQENSSSDKNIFLDTDQDGLSDDEEKTYGTDPAKNDTDGDGYSDGAEVKTGYDPLKPAPGDKITANQEQVAGEDDEKTSSQENLTEKLSNEVTELVSSRNSDGEEVSQEDLDTLIESTMNSELSFDDLPEVDEKEIKVKKQDYDNYPEEERKEKEKKDTVDYITVMGYIALSNSPKEITSLDDVESFSQEILNEAGKASAAISDPSYDISYFENLGKVGETTYGQLKEVEVPENILDLHKQAIKLAEYAISIKDELKPNPDDPVASVVNLSKVQNIIGLSTELAESAQKRLEGLGISDIPINL